MTTACQYCGCETQFDQVEACLECWQIVQAVGREFQKLPAGGRIRLARQLESQFRGDKQREFALNHPDHYDEGWKKRRQEQEEFRTAAGKKPRKKRIASKT